MDCDDEFLPLIGDPPPPQRPERDYTLRLPKFQRIGEPESYRLLATWADYKEPGVFTTPLVHPAQSSTSLYRTRSPRSISGSAPAISRLLV